MSKKCPKGSRRIPPKTGVCIENKNIMLKKCPKGTRRIPPKTGVCVEDNKTVRKQASIQNKINKLELKYKDLENKYNEFTIKINTDEKYFKEMGDNLDNFEKQLEKIEDMQLKKKEQKRLKELDKKYATYWSKISNEKNKNRLRKEKLKEIEDEIDRLKYIKGDVKHSEELTETEIENLIKTYTEIYNSNNDINNADIDIIKNKLRNLRFDNNYKCCFTGKRIRNLYQQANTRMECAIKDGELLRVDIQL